ncbi:MAG TPA: hypothetical protein VGM62_13855 [Chthoniobacterales bacterium]
MDKALSVGGSSCPLLDANPIAAELLKMSASGAPFLTIARGAADPPKLSPNWYRYA